MAKKNHTLLAMLAGAALAGGYLYMKKMNEQGAAEPAPAAEPDAEDPGTDYGWKATFTDENGEQVSADDAAAEFKEEAAKVLNEFKETAKVAGAELLAGLKKAYEEMKVAVADAQQAAAERRAEMTEEGGEAVDEALKDIKEGAEEVLEDAKDVFEEVKEAAEEKLEEVKEAFEDVKEAACEKVEDALEAAEEAAEEIKEKIEE